MTENRTSKKGWIWFLVGGLCCAFLFLPLIGFISLVLSFRGSDHQNYEQSGDIAILEIAEPIFSSQPIVDKLDQIEKNKSLKALILRIDTPGGSVGASQEIYQSVLRIKQNKKVIASLGNVAASGGYYIAVAADKIVANPGSITGSIGVLMDYANVQELLKFLKVDAELITAGKFKDVGSPLRPMTPDEKAYLQSVLDDMHQQFKKAVQEGRKFDEAKINEVADGRIFTGSQALALGLIDQLGNYQTSIDLAKEMISNKDPKIIYPKKDKANLFDLLNAKSLESVLVKVLYSLREPKALYWAQP